jgi:hypothetical protein
MRCCNRTNLPWSRRATDYVFCERLGLRTQPKALSRFYGSNGAVYRTRLSTASADINNFAMKIVLNVYEN